MDGASQPVVDRQASINRFRETRRRTAGLFDLLTEEAYYEQPIPLRHPVVFYEGHIPAFSVNTRSASTPSSNAVWAVTG